jgi:hypothetical protein
MNKGAIALAADSKVTVTTGGVSKTYDTVSKLFTLSKVAPIGVMIYGNAEFMGYPWETIIKLYRNQKGRDTEQLVVDWANDFFKFLGQFGHITKRNRDDNVESVCLSTLFEAVRTYDERAQADGISHGSDEYEVGLRNHLARRAAAVSRASPWVDKSRFTVLSKQFGTAIAKALVAHLDGYSSDTKKEAIAFLIGTLLLEVSSPQTSGVVIAGFGEREYFPTLVEYRVEGYIGTRIKKFLIPPVIDVSRTQNACVRAFAQREMVQRFMDGIDPSYSIYLSEAIPKLVVDNCFETLEKYGSIKNRSSDVREKITDAVRKSVKGFEDDAQHYRSESFSDPVVRMVSVLPKDELAHLAESLVALTSLKRRVSSDAETVGGPIDVALISKGDGFIWIKRKHYFDSELNPQFVRTYMDDVGYGERQDAERDRPKGARGAPATRPPGGGRATPQKAPKKGRS